MSLISVKANPGRVAYDAAQGGTPIPNDRFVLVEHTAWVERLITVHGDIAVEPPAARHTPQPAPVTKSE